MEANPRSYPSYSGSLLILNDLSRKTLSANAFLKI